MGIIKRIIVEKPVSVGPTFIAGLPKLTKAEIEKLTPYGELVGFPHE